MNLEYLYTKQFTVDNADYNGNVTIKCIMEILQIISTESANQLGFGHNLVRSNNLAWVLNKILIKFNRPIKMREKITFKTWPIQPKRFTAERDYIALDEEGNIVFSGTSVWCLIDLTKRTLSSTDVMKDIVTDYSSERAIKGFDFCRFKADETYLISYSKEIKISEIDINNHVNNTNYYTYAQDCLTKEDYDKTICQLEIKFIQELHLGDSLTLFYKKEQNKHYIIGKKQEKDVFSALITTND